MDRRDFLKILAATGLSPIMSGPLRAQEGYAGDLVLSVNVFGAWDVSSYCDPKLNTPDEPQINHWADGVGEIPKAGNIPYAPVWGNTEFFEKYYQDMLVINGVDAQTNSHTTGQIHAFSGRLGIGMPTYTSLVGAIHGSEIPLPYLNFGGYSGTGGLVIATQVSNPNALSDLAAYDLAHENGPLMFPPEVQELLNSKRLARLDGLLEDPYLLPKRRKALSELHLGLSNVSELKKFAAHMPDQLVATGDDLGDHPIYQQAQVAMIAYQAGLTVSADLAQGDNFDTHSNHDPEHETYMRRLNREIDFIWNLAEEMGLSDKITMIINSEFSRTPYYNGDAGKDHWPIGSVIVMKKGATWGNRVVGRTDEFQNVSALNPSTLQVDEDNGQIIYPKDIHQAIRRFTGVADFPEVQKFDLNTDVEFDFFNPDLSTPQLYT